LSTPRRSRFFAVGPAADNKRRRRQTACRPRTRRCLLKGCHQLFHPRQATQRYRSAAYQESARKWSRWKAQQRYRETKSGKEKRSDQSRRYRKRVNSRKPEESEAVNEAARVSLRDIFSTIFAIDPAATRDSHASGEVPCSTTARTLAGSDGARPRTGAPLKTGADSKLEILIRRGNWPYIQPCLMHPEFHQLDLRWEHLRVHHPARQRRLLASLATTERPAARN
jgi:hypothetical protein